MENTKKWNCSTARLQEILRGNEVLYSVIRGVSELGIAHSYIGAGCICQTVWNAQSSYDPMYGISDIDLVYFDETDISAQAEERVIRMIREEFPQLRVPIDVKNQARVHIWYQQRFGYEISAYRSCEESIATWPTTASAVGVRLNGSEFFVCAPFGLKDLFDRRICPNKKQITEEIYLRKCEKWRMRWPDLEIIPWE